MVGVVVVVYLMIEKYYLFINVCFKNICCKTNTYELQISFTHGAKIARVWHDLKEKLLSLL
jgi:hypothetical protein